MTGSTPKERARRIMLIDDDVEMLPLFEAVADVPHTVFTMQTGGLAALDTLHQLNYDVDAVILDLSMPDKDGLSVTKTIRIQEDVRSKQNPIHIVWMTGYPVHDDPTLMEAKEKYKVDKVFEKPASPIEVLEYVNDVLDCEEQLSCDDGE